MALDQYDSAFWPVDSWPSRFWPLGFWPLLVPLPPPPPIWTVTDLLWHSPAYILHKALLGAQPDLDIFVGYLPPSPDDVVGFFDTTPILEHRVGSGMFRRFYGLSVMVRSVEYGPGLELAGTIQDILKATYQQEIEIDDRRYRIRSVDVVTGVFPLGREREGPGRQLFSINFVASLTGLVL
jgi:hypothetical protein